VSSRPPEPSNEESQKQENKDPTGGASMRPEAGQHNADLSRIFLTKKSKTVHLYTGDLTNVQSILETSEDSQEKLTIRFKEEGFQGFQLEIRSQDLFESGADVTVNAANTDLCGGSGIDGATHKKGGALYEQYHQRDLKSLYPQGYVSGHAAMIPSGDIATTHHIPHVIVVAGPQGDATPEKENELYSCYFNSLLLAHLSNKKHIAFPGISTGVFKFPKDRAACISLRAVYDFVSEYPKSSLKTISIHYQGSLTGAFPQSYRDALKLSTT
jgi:O-acetyl-ADP-ribose deacetylase (regulator of RNase III)